MINIGINGLGRVGRALLKANLDNKYFNLLVVNDIDPDIDNHCYLIEYDSVYGKIQNHTVKTKNNKLIIDDSEIIHFYSYSSINDVPWDKHNVDIVIDSSGVFNNVVDSNKLVHNSSVSKVIITFSPDEGVDATILLGVNEDKYNKKIHHVISSSICDANAVAPFFKIINENFGIEIAEVTTLHPWLQYQNLLDGTVKSVSNPGHFWKDYALGRSAVSTLIPKRTSLVNALEKVLPGINIIMNATSFRVPTSNVSAADGVFLLKQKAEINEIINEISEFRKRYPNVVTLENKSLVSSDYSRRKEGAIIDQRWLNINNQKMLKFVLWYDNEYGYASRTLELARFLMI